MKSKTFQIRDNQYWSEQVIDFIDLNIDESKDLLVTISIEKT